MRPLCLCGYRTLSTHPCDPKTVHASLDRIARAAAEEGVEGPALLVVGEVVDALPRRRLEELLSAVG